MGKFLKAGKNALGLFEVANTISEFANAIKADSELRLFKKQHPEDWIILNTLGSVMIQAGLNIEKIPGAPAWACTRRIKGFSIKEMNIVSCVIPENKAVVIYFIPNVFVHEGYKFLASDFLALFNSNIPVGCAMITGTQAKGIQGKESLTFCFSISINYADISSLSRKILENMLRNVLDVVPFLPIGLEYLQTKGWESPVETSVEAFNKSQVISKEKKPTATKSNDTILLNLVKYIESEHPKYKIISQGEKLVFTGGTKEVCTRTIYVNTENQIILETHLANAQSLQNAESRKQIVRFIDIVNNELINYGKLMIDTSRGLILYKTGVDMLGAENDLSQQMINNILITNEEISDFVLPGIKEVLAGGYSRDTFDKLIEDNNLIETDLEKNGEQSVKQKTGVNPNLSEQNIEVILVQSSALTESKNEEAVQIQPEEILPSQKTTSELLSKEEVPYPIKNETEENSSSNIDYYKILEEKTKNIAIPFLISWFEKIKVKVANLITSFRKEKNSSNFQVNKKQIVSIAIFTGFALVSLLIFGFLKNLNSLSTLSSQDNRITLTQAIETSIASLIFNSSTIQPSETSLPQKASTSGSTSTKLSLPNEILDNNNIPMQLIPAGDFLMGDNIDKALASCTKYIDNCQTSWFENSAPLHTIYLASYYIDTYEVTNSQYKTCVDAGMCIPPKANNSGTRNNYYNDPQYSSYPVVYVDWNMAQSYCEWRGGYLPSEAQWEKAARGTDGRTYTWGEDLSCEKTNYLGCVGNTVSVGTYINGTSPYEIHDMSGNVSEWVSDWYSENYYSESPKSNPLGPNQSLTKIIRGGSWFGYELFTDTSIRVAVDITFADDFVGFRCASNINLSLTNSTPRPSSTIVPINIIEITTTPIACSNFVSQLKPNIIAQVATDAINMRENPGTTQTVVRIIYTGEKVQLSNESPVCAEGYLWWKVKATNSGDIGWGVEGTTDERWLLP